MQQDHSEHEPQGIRGSSVVLVLFLIIAVITVVGYLAFRHMLGSPQ